MYPGIDPLSESVAGLLSPLVIFEGRSNARTNG
jgi:hypothetical protein